MDISVLKMVFQIIIFLPLTLFLIYVIIKYGGDKLQNISRGSIIKIIERVQVSKDSFLVIAKVLDKFYLISTSGNKNEILKELDGEQVEKLLKEKKNNSKKNVDNILSKILLKKEEWNEEKK